MPVNDFTEVDKQLTQRRLDVQSLQTTLNSLQAQVRTLSDSLTTLTTTVNSISNSGSSGDTDTMLSSGVVLHNLPHKFKNIVTFLGNLVISGAVVFSGNLGFWGSAAATKQTLAAYASNSQSVAYTGIATGVVGTPYAQLTDLNTLRLAYQNLLAMCNDLRTKLQTSTFVG